MAMSKAKIFNDPVHGHIEMPSLCVRIIDTPYFQRLRNIKQLGGCYFVYPGAAHNRFEHSIGTAHLAGCLVESLQTRQDLGITKKDVLCVKIAGLCHDLGHGPFSHLFDRSFIPSAPNSTEEKWKHEKASLAMVELLWQEGKLQDEEDVLTNDDVTFIKELIDGPIQESSNKDWPYKGRDKDKGFLYEIISNKESGIDVDKWDYFARDCLHLGMKSSFDHMRCIKMARVIKADDGKWHICYRDKEVNNIYEMFHVRSMLHRRAYQHKTSNAVEHMINEALLKADPHLEMSEKIKDMKAYTKLTDQVYYQILYSTEDNLKEAREILERIERRELYRLIGERPDKYSAGKTISCEENQKEEIIKEAKPLTNEIQTGDLILEKVKFDYGMKEKNPVESVYFYKKNKPDEAFKFRKDEVSYMLPKDFIEWKIRLYLRKELGEDKTDLEQLKNGFDKWFNIQVGAADFGGERKDATPEKDPPAESRDGGGAKKKLKMNDE